MADDDRLVDEEFLIPLPLGLSLLVLSGGIFEVLDLSLKGVNEWPGRDSSSAFQEHIPASTVAQQ